jgi:hypothetical protein
MLDMPPDILKERLLFLCHNYKLFRCEAVFFHNHLPTLDAIKPPIISKFIRYFYVVEPLPMICLADYATSRLLTPDFLFQKFPNVLNTIASLHSVRFPYLNLSPFSVIVDDTFSIRPPPLNPFASPKSLLPPPPKVYRSSFRSVNEIRFYQAPEWNAVHPFCSSDSWSLGAILAELLVLGGPVFGSLSREDQMKRTQQILGPAPKFLQWPPATVTIPCELPPLILELLDYDPQRRPWLCIHFCQRILAFIHGMAVRDGEVAQEDEGEVTQLPPKQQRQPPARPKPQPQPKQKQKPKEKVTEKPIPKPKQAPPPAKRAPDRPPQTRIQEYSPSSASAGSVTATTISSPYSGQTSSLPTGTSSAVVTSSSRRATSISTSSPLSDPRKARPLPPRRDQSFEPPVPARISKKDITEEEEEEEEESPIPVSKHHRKVESDQDEEEDYSLRPYSQPFSSAHERRTSVRSRSSASSSNGREPSVHGDSTTQLESSQEVRDLRHSIEEIEKSFVASRDRRLEKAMGRDSEESPSSSVDGDLVEKIQSMKRRLAELDKRVLDGCEGCVAADEVDLNLREQEAILGQTFESISTDTLRS